VLNPCIEVLLVSFHRKNSCKALVILAKLIKMFVGPVVGSYHSISPCTSFGIDTFSSLEAD